MGLQWMSGMDRMEARFNQSWPWRKVSREIFREFCIWLGNQNLAVIKGGMSPYRAGLGYVINCEKFKNDLEKLEAAWDEFDEVKIQAAVAEELRNKTLQVKAASSPPVIDLDDTRQIRLGLLRHMARTGRKPEALKLIEDNPDWGIEVGNLGERND